MGEILEVKVVDEESIYSHSQEIYTELSDGDNLYFKAVDLCDCPEDAILERALFDAYDYVNALNKGIKLAKMGYDKVVTRSVVIKNNDNCE